MIVDIQDDSGNPNSKRRRRGASLDMLSFIKIALPVVIFLIGFYSMYLRVESIRDDFQKSLRSSDDALANVRAQLKVVSDSVDAQKRATTDIRSDLLKVITREDVVEMIATATTTSQSKDREALLEAAKRAASSDLAELRSTVTKLGKAQEEMLKGLTDLQLIDARAKITQIEASMTELRRMLGIGPQPNAQQYLQNQQQQQQQQYQQQQQPQEVRSVVNDAAAAVGYADGVSFRDEEKRRQAEEQQRQNGDVVAGAATTTTSGDGATLDEFGFRVPARGRKAGNFGGAPAFAPSLPEPWPKPKDEAERNQRRLAKVKEEFLFSWNAYKKHAWGHDELCPVSKTFKDWGGGRSKGLALTAVDALTTLWLMDLHDEFEAAVNLIVDHVDFSQDIKVSAFEATIRIVGSLLSSYELSGEKDERLLRKAQEMMDRVLVAYNTTTAVPHQTLNLKQRTHWSPDWTAGAGVLSEFGSVQMELRTLSFHTKNPIYDMKATHQMSVIKSKCPTDLLCPTMFDLYTGEFRDDHVTLGALGDSFYEYLLKQFLLTGKTELQYRKMALTALDSIITHLVRYSQPGRQAYLAERMGGQLDHKMDELACFAGGMFALASLSMPDSGSAKTFLRVGQDLTETCFTMFRSQETGIAPEIVEFQYGRDMTSSSPYYLLRPETSESLFYMWRATKQQRYRDMQWFIFSHIMEHCRVDSGGYSGIRNVNILPVELDDQQQSFWLAETLKYIYLTFADDSVIDLSKWVFNTEAHPLKIRARDPLDVWRQWEESHGGAMPWYPPFIEGVVDVETEGMRRARMASGEKRIAPVDPLSVEEPADEEADYQVQQQVAQQQQEMADAEQQQQQQQQRRQEEEDTEKRRKAAVERERGVRKVYEDKLKKISRHISADLGDALPPPQEQQEQQQQQQQVQEVQPEQYEAEQQQQQRQNDDNRVEQQVEQQPDEQRDEQRDEQPDEQPLGGGDPAVDPAEPVDQQEPPPQATE